LSFVAAMGVQETLWLHHQVDVCLDSFPYSGSTTTSHALWMGVPTLTMVGSRPAGRMGAALAGYLGLGDFVAGSEEEFVGKAACWGRNLEGLSEVRMGLRRRFAGSVLMDAEVVMGAWVREVRGEWRRWCGAVAG